MNELNKEEFDKLIQEKKFTEAEEMLKNYLSQAWTEDEEGEYYVQLMNEYIDLSNIINQSFIEQMKEIKKSLETVEEIEGEVEKQSKIEDIKKKIEGL